MTTLFSSLPGGTALERTCFVFLLLMVYSFLGWCGEMVYCSIGQRRLCEKRGFLNGPLCPIYGHGALVVLLALNGGCESPVLTFLLGAVLTSAVEYVTSYAMEKLFHMRWWDYSRYKFHINGRVCLLNSSLFGLASVLLCHAANPVVAGKVAWLFEKGAGVPLAVILFVLYGADIVLSVRSAIQIGSRLEKLHAIHDELAQKLEELKAEQRQAMEAQRARLEELAAKPRQTAGAQKARLEHSLEAVRHTAAERTAGAAQKVQSKLEPLTGLTGEFAQRLDRAKTEAQQKRHALYEGQDFFERRMMRSFPTLRSPRHSEALNKLREYWEERKK